jgi:hypothetical protein
VGAGHSRPYRTRAWLRDRNRQRADPAAARDLINQLTMRQNYSTLGAFRAQRRRVVGIHHTIEDQMMFPSREIVV